MFRGFLLKAEIANLAVAVMLGIALVVLVNQFVGSFITPLIAAIGGEADFRDLDWTINDARFRWGLFLNELITFLIIAVIVYFFVVRRVALLSRDTHACPQCFSDVPVDAKRCAFCAVQIPVMERDEQSGPLHKDDG